MYKTAFLFAGQGSQKTGMGEDFYNDFSEFREAFDSADLDFDLHDICFRNPENLLLQTEYTQPCMVAFACGITAILYRNGVVPDYVCGLSLGEYSALNAADVMDAATAIETAAFRGKVMADASRGIDVGMIAVVGLDECTIQLCCKKAKDTGIVSITNYNCPGQIVIGGEKKAVNRAAILCKESGAKRCLHLSVSGPFHTVFMESAGNKLREYFSRLSFEPEKMPVLFNYLGREKNENMDIPELLVQQVQKPVRMEECIIRLFDLGVRRFIEIGPGKVLAGFVKKVAKKIECAEYEVRSIECVEDLQEVLF